MQSGEDKQSTPNFLTRIMNSQNKEYLAYSLLFVSSFFWVYLWIYPNEHNFNFTETNLVRGIALTIFPYFICQYYGQDTNSKNSENYYWLNVRNVIQVFFAFSMGFVQLVLPLPIVHTTHASGNIFIFFWDYYLFQTKINSKQLKGIIVGMVGILLLVNGRVLITLVDPSYEASTEFENYKTENLIVTTIVGFLFTVVIFIWSYAIVITKKLDKVSLAQINFHQGILVTLISAFCYPFSNNNIDMQHMITAFFVTGIPGLVGQLMFIGGLKLSKNTGVITMINFSCVIWAYLVSIFRYGESQNPICSLGAVLVVGGVCTALFSKKSD